MSKLTDTQAKAPRAKSRPSSKRPTKQAAVLRLLHRKTGASLTDMMAATNWQAHSVRGFLSGTVKKKLGLPLLSETAKNGGRRYRIAADETKGSDA